jgi:hypothetical protein
MSMEPHKPVEPIRLPSDEERALRKTIYMLIPPAIGVILWELLMFWCEIHVVAGTSAVGVPLFIGTLFGLPALSGAYYGVWKLYHHILDDIKRDSSSAKYRDFSRY